MKRYLGRVREEKKNVYNISLVTHHRHKIVKHKKTQNSFSLTLPHERTERNRDGNLR